MQSNSVVSTDIQNEPVLSLEQLEKDSIRQYNYSYDKAAIQSNNTSATPINGNSQGQIRIVLKQTHALEDFYRTELQFDYEPLPGIANTPLIYSDSIDQIFDLDNVLWGGIDITNGQKVYDVFNCVTNYVYCKSSEQNSKQYGTGQGQYYSRYEKSEIDAGSGAFGFIRNQQQLLYDQLQQKVLMNVQRHYKMTSANTWVKLNHQTDVTQRAKRYSIRLNSLIPEHFTCNLMNKFPLQLLNNGIEINLRMLPAIRSHCVPVPFSGTSSTTGYSRSINDDYQISNLIIKRYYYTLEPAGIELYKILLAQGKLVTKMWGLQHVRTNITNTSQQTVKHTGNRRENLGLLLFHTLTSTALSAPTQVLDFNLPQNGNSQIMCQNRRFFNPRIGNIQLIFNGEEAYPKILQSINDINDFVAQELYSQLGTLFGIDSTFGISFLEEMFTKGMIFVPLQKIPGIEGADYHKNVTDFDINISYALNQPVGQDGTTVMDITKLSIDSYLIYKQTIQFVGDTIHKSF